MTIEQLKRGRELFKEIAALENELTSWIQSSNIHDVLDKISISAKNKPIYSVRLRFVDFNTMKHSAIDNIRAELNELAKEFNEL